MDKFGLFGELLKYISHIRVKTGVKNSYAPRVHYRAYFIEPAI